MVEVTPEGLIRLGNSIKQLLDNQGVQDVWQALDELYYKQWKAAKTVEERERLSVKVEVLGELKQKLEVAVVAGQHEAHRLAQADAEG